MKMSNKDENQCPAAAKPGLHFNSLILENLLSVQRKGKCHVSVQIGRLFDSQYHKLVSNKTHRQGICDISLPYAKLFAQICG